MPEGEAMRKRSNEEEQVGRLYEQLAESVLSLSDSDLLSVYEESAEGDAEAVIRLVQKATKGVCRKKLADAKEAYERQVAAMKSRHYEIPSTPSKRRELLMSAIAGRPGVGSVLTAQFRDLSGMSDADVESALRQLFELGFLQAESSS